MKFSTIRTQNGYGLAPRNCRAGSDRLPNGWHRVLLMQDEGRFKPSHILIAAFITAVVAVALMTTPFGSSTLAQSLSCGITQITFTTGGFKDGLELSDDGTRLAFLSNGNLTGGNVDGN